MNERSRRDLNASLAGAAKVVTREVTPERRYVVPKRDARPTPYSDVRKFPDGRVEATLHLPICCFPAYRGDGKPSTVRVLAADHPVMQGVPATFQIPQTEMYDEPFHVPAPDTVLFEESWAPGEWFRSGMFWKLGKGTVMYFRPGHETYPVFKQEAVLKILTNAVRWLGRAEA
ncbi:MAG: ThuA domain-containing protein [Isosphaeraceae bacterium]